MSKRPAINTKRTSKKSNGILIIGDWVIDEYEYVVPTQSSTSSHAGPFHSRVVSDDRDLTMELCGAGHVARILFDLRDKPLECPLFGLGLWNEKDTELIVHLLHRCQVAKPSAAVLHTWCDDPPAEVTLATMINDHETLTIRRDFLLRRSKTQQIGRTDKRYGSLNRERHNPGVDWLDSLPTDAIRSVVVLDLCKGAVNKKIIKKLAGRFRKATWYIRSKARKPPWLEHIPKPELILIGSEHTNIINPTGSWLVGGQVSLGAREILDDYKGRSVVLLTDRGEIIAKLNDGKESVTGRSLAKIEGVDRIGWSSAVFASLIYSNHVQPTGDTSDSISEAIVNATKLCKKRFESTTSIPQSSPSISKPKPNWISA